MFDQELREGAHREEGESFKKFAVRRLLVALIALVGRRHNSFPPQLKNPARP